MNTKEKARKGGAPVRRKTRVKAKKAVVYTNVKAENAIIYTQPKPFERRKFLLRMATVVAVVLALVLGMSIFFKVDIEKVTVSGEDKYTRFQVREASGIRDGENLLTLNKAKISGKIITKLPYVKTVRIGVKLPDIVKIEIQEMDVVYAIADAEGGWWLMDASGKVVESVSSSNAKTYCQIQGVVLQSPTVGTQAVAAEAVPATNEAGETVPVTVLESERLRAAINILQCLEENGVIGQAASVNVSDVTMLELWYEDHYQVLLGDSTNLSRKIESMVKAIDQQKDYQRGVLDVSFTTWGNQVNLSPFSE